MKVIIQVVKEANVKVQNKIVHSIQEGYVLFVGIEKTDTLELLAKMAKKIAFLRINADENGKTNLSILDTQKEILSISQFTLCATLEGRRPSFSNAMEAINAKSYYLQFNEELKKYNITVKEGCFQQHMEIFLINDGPFTIYLDDSML